MGSTSNKSRYFGVLSLSLLALGARGAKAASSIQLRPVPNTPTSVGVIGGSGTFSLALDTHSLVPFSSPFRTIDGDPTKTTTKSYDYRFQTSTGFSMELDYGLGSELEVGVLLGWEGYNGRSSDIAARGQAFDSVDISQFPIEGVVRYHKATPGWAPEGEVGVGWGFGSLKMSSTNTTLDAYLKAQSTGFGFLRGHVAGGVGYPWTDEISLHVRVGYAVQTFGSKNYYDSAGSGLGIKQALLNGLYLNAQMRWQF